MTLQMDRLLRMREVAEILTISSRQAYRLAEIGELKAVRFGKTVRVREADLEQFIERHLNHQDTENTK